MSDWQSAPMVRRGAAPAQGEDWELAPAIGKAPGKKKTSAALGVLEPIYDVGRKVVDFSPANLIPGFKEANEGSLKRLKGRIDERRETEKPSVLTETAASLALTSPLMMSGAGPLAMGAGQGAALSEAEDPVGIGLDALGGAALNKMAGVATDKVIDALSPMVSPAVRKLADAGVRLTPGQIRGGKALVREDKAMSRPIVGERIAEGRAQFQDDFNRGAVNRAVLPLGVRLPDNVTTGHDAAAWMQQQAGGAYDKILPGLKLQADPRLAVGLRKAWSAAQDLAPADQQRFLQIVQNKLRFDENGSLTGRPLAVALRDLRDLAGGFAKGQDEDKRILGAALGEVHEGLQSALIAQNPAAGRALKAANEAYKGNLVVNRAAASADDGIATTAQFKTASRAVDRTKGKRATAAGRGPMQDYVSAGRAVSGKTPNSGTAERLLEGNMVAKGRGAVDAGLYEIDKAMAALRLAPRPEIAQKLAGLLSNYARPASIAGGPVLGGLLAGLLPRE